MSIKLYSREFEFFREKIMLTLQEEFAEKTSLTIQNTDKGQIVIGDYGRFTWNGFHFFNGISKAEFQVLEKPFGISIESKLYFFEAFFIALLFSIIPAFTSPTLKFHIQDHSYSVLFWLIFLIWPVLYFGNMLISAIRVNNFLKKRIKRILDEERNFLIEKKIEQVRLLNTALNTKTN